MSLFASGNQTVGPYLHIGLEWLTTRDIAGKGIKGERVAIAGRLIDGDGNGVNDGLIEIWQANAEGKYAHPEDTQKKPIEKGWRGFGRIPTDAKGGFRFTTIKPGRVPGPGGGLQAPHLVVSVFMRGMLKHLATRIYFPDETAANAQDPVLGLVPPARRATLMPKKKGKALEWNVVLQGKNETVFFDY
ncbi:MAG: protocatechuate 3,4-dioxygenase, alpha subunit [Betaproteobacteria bacterium]|jgi:protocatechuate 3,4-dioxygenase alpha subunit|nr:protocatechuate 3,4-dioxygenase, alpha subunit [Betaproteobacteria bacterium]